MVIISTAADLRTWVSDHGGLSDDVIVDAVVDAIRSDGSSPAWGLNWGHYLATVDIVETVVAGHLMRTCERGSLCQLRAGAADAGDEKQVALCDRALAGDAEAMAACANVIAYAAAEVES